MAENERCPLHSEEGATKTQDPNSYAILMIA